MNISVSVNLDMRRLNALINDALSAAHAEARTQAEALRDDLQRRAPRKTGTFATGIRTVERGEFDYAVELPGMPGRFIIDGTRPHTITARAGGVLRWTTPGGGVAYARVVHHPGTKPNDFAQRAAQDAVGRFQGGLRSMLRGLIR